MSAASDDEPEVPPPMGESTFTCEEKFQVTNNKGQHKAVFEVSQVDGKKFVHVAARILERLHLVDKHNVGVCATIAKRLRLARDAKFNGLLQEQGGQQRTAQRRYTAKGMVEKVLMMPETTEIDVGGNIFLVVCSRPGSKLCVEAAESTFVGIAQLAKVASSSYGGS